MDFATAQLGESTHSGPTSPKRSTPPPPKAPRFAGWVERGRERRQGQQHLNEQPRDLSHRAPERALSQRGLHPRRETLREPRRRAVHRHTVGESRRVKPRELLGRSADGPQTKSARSPGVRLAQHSISAGRTVSSSSGCVEQSQAAISGPRDGAPSPRLERQSEGLALHRGL